MYCEVTDARDSNEKRERERALTLLQPPVLGCELFWATEGTVQYITNSSCTDRMMVFPILNEQLDGKLRAAARILLRPVWWGFGI